MTDDTTEALAGGRVLISRDGPVARITFNKPERMNAMSLDMWKGLNTALAALAGEDAIRVVVLRGAGDKAFVSGADISEFDTLRASEDGVQAYNAVSEAADRALHEFLKPTIAEIKGYCVGGGMGIALSCDIRVCADDSRLGITAAKLGLAYGLDGVCKLVDIAGPETAAKVLYSAELFPAEQARIMGLVSEVVLRTELEAAVSDLAARIAGNAPLTIRAAKAAIRAASRPEETAAHDRVARLVADCFASEDYAEGRRAFAEKRKPRFTGR